MYLNTLNNGSIMSHRTKYPTLPPKRNHSTRAWGPTNGNKEIPQYHTRNGMFTYMDGWFFMVNVGEYTSPMDRMGMRSF